MHPTHRPRRTVWLFATLALLLALLRPTPAIAQNGFGVLDTPGLDTGPKAEVAAHANFDQVQPGQQVVVAIVLDVVEGYHAQSATPLTDNLIPFRIAIGESEGATIYAPLYDEPHIENYPLISPDTGGDLSVYTGRSIHYLPVEVAPDATGTVRISGAVTVQICDDKACLPPEDLPWSVELPVVAAGEPVSPANTELFADFDPSTWSDLKPFDADAAEAGSGRSYAFKIFGVAFDLADWGAAMVLVFAFIAGIFFNVVPCVLPVLPLKAISFYEVAQHRRGKCLALGVAFGIGVIAVFIVLALMLFAFKAFTWGEPFSNPWFSGIVAAILLIMAAYQFGLLTFALPQQVYAFTPRHDTYTGNVAFGGLTAILSTPCTFGLFAALLAWAATQPTWLAVSAVSMTGVGMAFPYILLSAFPEAARNLPRSGPWSEVVKQATGFLLLAVALFFAKTALRPILPAMLAGDAYWWVIFAPVVLGCIFLVIAAAKIGSLRGTIISGIVAAAILGVTLPIFWRLATPPAGWIYYSESAVADARATDQPVLIKFTADWCLNCKTVEARVFGDEEQIEAWKEAGLVLIKADLTDRDAPGWPMLSELNPARAIPFTAVYLPGEEEPRTLSGIYGTDDLRAVLESGD